MATQAQSLPGGEAKPSGAGLSVVAVVCIALAVLPLLFFVISLIRGSGPNQGGNQRNTQLIDTTPTSPLNGALGDLERYSDTQSYLNKNSSFLTDTQAKLTTLSSQLKARDAAFKNIPSANITKMVDVLIPEMVAQLTNIQQALTAANTSEATRQAQAFQTNIERLNQLAYSAGNLVGIARSVVDANNDGKGSIDYSSSKTEPKGLGPIDKSTNLPEFADCSGFISYLFQRVGVFGKTETATVDSFFNNYASTVTQRKVFNLVYKGSSLSESDLQNFITDGRLAPGDILLRFGDRDHMMMYIGGSNPDQLFVQSTRGNSDGKVGPQYASLNRAGKGRYSVVLRPPIAQ